MEHQADGVTDSSTAVDAVDLPSLLRSADRDFLVRNNGDQVKVDSLQGKKIGLYFSASWCGPCQRFTPELAEVYNKLSANGDFEIVFLSADEDEESFNAYFKKMPWLAVPFSDSDTRNRLDEFFRISGIPHFIIFGENGKVLTEDGVEIIMEHGVEGYPFTPQRVKEIKELEMAARMNQSIKTILVSQSRDFVISSDGKKVSVAELQGKTVGLYFSLSSYDACNVFTLKLKEVYEKLKETGDNFEVVMIPLDEDEESFKQGFEVMPWLSLPFKEKTCQKLVRYFELSDLPTLVIIGPDGKTLHNNVTEVIEEHGALAYPFTQDRFAELAEIEKAKLDAQTLESILVSGDLNFVISKEGSKIPVSNLIGKNILLYFSAHWCPPCRAFLPKLVEAYHQIKAKDDAFEVIFISSDSDQASFEEFFSEMPWLALPFGDERKKYLSKIFKVRGIPMLVALGPTGRTLTTEARELVMHHGADAYPFTEERLKKIDEQCEEMAKGWPEKVKHKLHKEHDLELSRRKVYNCDGCGELGNMWAFSCGDCDFDLHPKCALEDDVKNKDVEMTGDENEPKKDWICDGEVCYRA